MYSTMDCINYLGWELRGEFEIALTDGDKLNFYRYFLGFNVKKKIMRKGYFQFDSRHEILDIASLNI